MVLDDFANGLLRNIFFNCNGKIFDCKEFLSKH